MSDALLAFDASEGSVEFESVRGESLVDGFPDTTGTAVCWEAESSVGTPDMSDQPDEKRRAKKADQLPAVFLLRTFETTSLSEGAATRSPSHSHCIYNSVSKAQN